MKRQMKMTTSKEPQKKFLGGAMKNIIGKVGSAVKKASQAQASKAAEAAPATKEGASIPKKGLADLATSGRSSGRGLKGLIGSGLLGKVAKAVGAAAKKKKKGASAAIPAAGGTMGMKKGGAVMKDKMGRAMKKTTADAKGRAMRKGK